MDILGSEQDELEDAVIRRVTLTRIRELLSTLPKRECLVLEMRYGMLDGRAHPQHEVAKRLGISRSYVSRRRYWKRCPKAGNAPSGIDIWGRKQQFMQRRKTA